MKNPLISSFKCPYDANPIRINLYPVNQLLQKPPPTPNIKPFPCELDIP